jgi:hypothetical protein
MGFSGGAGWAFGQSRSEREALLGLTVVVLVLVFGDGGGVRRGKTTESGVAVRMGNIVRAMMAGSVGSSLPFQPTIISIQQPLLGRSPTPKTCCPPRAFQPQVTHQAAACSVGRAPSQV